VGSATLPPVVSQITESERVTRIQQLLAELHKMPPEKHETVHMPWTAGEPLLEVIRIGVDEVVLNPQSHRIRAQLQDDPEWEALSREPYGEPAQRLIERHVRAARTPEEFSALKQSLLQDGQTDPGVMTHTGLLINANTRVVAFREVEDPLKRSIRVAVLPPTAKPEDLALLELRLQMQKQLKVEYTMTNELLFIEELSVKRGMSAAQIATELRIAPESARKGESEVQLRLKLLDLIRIMQRLPTEPLRLTFFDERISLEQLRELYRVYTPLLESDPRAARTHLESFLLSIAVGVSAVHQIRHIDADFMSSYMLPSLEEDELVGPVADALAARTDAAAPFSQPSGVELLDARELDDGELPDVDTARLIDVVTAADKRVEVPGTNFILDQDEVKDAVKAAITVGIKDKKRVQKDEDQLAAPSAAVKQATQQVTRAKEAVMAIRDDPDFDERLRKTLEAAYKKLNRTSRDLEAVLVKTGVLPKS
jgi:hypothetical protein